MGIPFQLTSTGTAKINLGIPYQLKNNASGLFKFGGKARLKEKLLSDQPRNVYSWEGDGILK